MKSYQTIVRAIGSEARLFQEEKLLILFGRKAPDTLKEYCFTIDVNAVTSKILPSMRLAIDQESYLITAVGEIVEKNLAELGHLTIKFDGAACPELPGTLHVAAGGYPTIEIGTVIVIK